MKWGGGLVNGEGILSSSWKENLLSLTQEVDEQAVKNDYHLCCLLLEKNHQAALCSQW